ncbi:hypothetical protein CR513_42814, partial [Mucuna pruriens]
MQQDKCFYVQKRNFPSKDELAVQRRFQNPKEEIIQTKTNEHFTVQVKKVHKVMENEAHTVNILPLFKGQNYDYWKQKMIAFYDICHINIGNGNYIPTNKGRVEILRSSWNKEQKTRYLLNSKVRNFPMCALTKAEYKKVHSCNSSKEMWDTLALAYEDHEIIDQMFGRFETIINNLRSLG